MAWHLLECQKNKASAKAIASSRLFIKSFKNSTIFFLLRYWATSYVERKIHQYTLTSYSHYYDILHSRLAFNKAPLGTNDRRRKFKYPSGTVTEMKRRVMIPIIFVSRPNSCIFSSYCNFRLACSSSQKCREERGCQTTKFSRSQAKVT